MEKHLVSILVPAKWSAEVRQVHTSSGSPALVQTPWLRRTFGRVRQPDALICVHAPWCGVYVNSEG